MQEGDVAVSPLLFVRVVAAFSRLKSRTAQSRFFFLLFDYHRQPPFHLRIHRTTGGAVHNLHYCKQVHIVKTGPRLSRPACLLCHQALVLAYHRHWTKEHLSLSPRERRFPPVHLLLCIETKRHLEHTDANSRMDYLRLALPQSKPFTHHRVLQQLR